MRWREGVVGGERERERDLADTAEDVTDERGGEILIASVKVVEF